MLAARVQAVSESETSGEDQSGCSFEKTWTETPDADESEEVVELAAAMASSSIEESTSLTAVAGAATSSSSITDNAGKTVFEISTDLLTQLTQGDSQLGEVRISDLGLCHRYR